MNSDQCMSKKTSKSRKALPKLRSLRNTKSMADFNGGLVNARCSDDPGCKPPLLTQAGCHNPTAICSG